VAPNRGFTLLEVILALAVGGLAVLTAERLFVAAGDGGRALAHSRQHLDRDANARRWLEATFLSLDVGGSAASGFNGTSDRVRFTSWQLTSGGWFEPRQIDLRLNDARIIAGGSSGEPLILAENISDIAFDYLLQLGAEAPWVNQWISTVSAPLAVRLRLGREHGVVDTLLFLIKERG